MDSLYKNEYGNGPRSTPTIDNGVVYGLSAKGKLFAVDAVSGSTTWSIDLVDKYHAQVPYWGVSASPVINREMLLINNCGTNGNGIIALNKSTAELIWKSETESDSYSTPLIVEIGNVEQAVVQPTPKLWRDFRVLWVGKLQVSAFASARLTK